MKLEKVNLSEAKWIGSGVKNQPIHIYKSLNIKDFESVKVTVGCFGSIILKANGQKVSDQYFLPLNTDFEERQINYGAKPFNEQLGHRLYCPVFDITKYLKNGLNELEFMLGSGFYELYGYGVAKLCFKIEIIDQNNQKTTVFSNGTELYKESYVLESNMVYGEKQNFLQFEQAELKAVKTFETPKTETYFDCFPSDKVAKRIFPENLGNGIFDIGENLSGIVVLKSKKAGEIKLRYGECLDQNGGLLKSNVFGQHTEFVTDNKERLICSEFTWHTFRYFEVTGEAEVIECLSIHSDVKQTAEFECDNEILNWLQQSYVRTQLNNMHCGVPSDCPHVERRGYTGDGQLTCKAAMLQLSAKDFYKKWIYDIFDCQDKLSGHVQYTAPFVPSGGGPGGWGSAIVIVPFEYYKNYGDNELLEEAYPKMLKWFDFMEAHSQEDIVVSDIDGVWCLGDWCAPAQDELNKMGGMRIPVPFVNTYFYIKCLEIVKQICFFLERSEDIAELQNKIDRKKKAITEKYFNSATGDFAENEQGANAFAVDLGLGDKRTFENMVKHYTETKQYDTGIFGTDIVTRVLFEKGRSDLAIKLLTSKEKVSYYSQMKTGATTLFEYWNGVRSHCHPMFGAVTKYLFEYVLGIKQDENSVLYKSVVIEPTCFSQIPFAKGKIVTQNGEISVEYNKQKIKVSLPKNIKGVLKINGAEQQLTSNRCNEYKLN